jgi:uncharacterized membrane protein YhaH (DUF805 family)
VDQTPITVQPIPQSPAIETPLNNLTSTNTNNSFWKRFFGGRINRLEYLVGVILSTTIYTILFAIMNMVNFMRITSTDGQAGLSAPIGVAVTILFVILMFYNFSFSIRRLHDLDKSGWLCLLSFIPFANIYIGIITLFQGGAASENKYGFQPTGVSIGKVFGFS